MKRSEIIREQALTLFEMLASMVAEANPGGEAPAYLPEKAQVAIELAMSNCVLDCLPPRE